MSDSKEDWNKNNPNPDRPFKAENIGINPDEFPITEVEEEPNQRPGCSNENTTSNTIMIDGGTSDKKMPIKFEFGLPPISQNKSNIRITWDTKDFELENGLIQNISVNASLNIPHNELMQGVNAYLKTTDRSKKNTKTTGTQTTSFDAASSSGLPFAAKPNVGSSAATPYIAPSRFNLPYIYKFPTESDEDDDDDDD